MSRSLKMHIEKEPKKYFSIELFDAGFRNPKCGHGHILYRLMRLLTFNIIIIYCLELFFARDFRFGFTSFHYDGHSQSNLLLGFVTISWLGRPIIQEYDILWRFFERNFE
jgi:hypothetical protein